MKTLYESLLDREEEIIAKSEEYMELRKLIKDIGFLEFNPSNISTNVMGGSTNWLKNLNIQTDYTNLFEPYIKKQKNVFKKYAKECAWLIYIILNMLMEVKNSHRKIRVWDYQHVDNPRPSGLIYLENQLKKTHHLNLQITCADMVDGGSIVIRLEFYDIDRGTSFYLYFDEDKFYKYIN